MTRKELAQALDHSPTFVLRNEAALGLLGAKIVLGKRSIRYDREKVKAALLSKGLFLP